MKKMTKILALLLAVLMIVPALVACGKKDDQQADNTAEPSQNTPAPGENTPEPGKTDEPEVTPAPQQDRPEGNYTYHLSMGASPINWNPHAWEMNNESTMMSYIEAPLCDISIAADGVNFEWVFEMATSLEDVTATYADREKWLTPDADGNLPTEHLIYKIELNPDAKWADGTPINADTYIYSMQQMLDCNMKNYRANSYFDGDTAIKNAKNYYNNDKVGMPIFDQYLNVEDGGDMYFSVDAIPLFLTDGSISEYGGAGYGAYWTYHGGDKDGQSIYDEMVAYIAEHDAEDGFEDGFVKVTEGDDLYQMILASTLNFSGNDESNVPEWMFAVVGEYKKTEWEDVGLVKGGDYTLYYINENPVSEFYMKSMMTSNWIVYKDLYEAGKSQKEDLTVTNYGTSAETYMSSGPYMLESFEADKQFVLVRNPNWYGWTDGKHVNQYWTSKVIYDIIAEHATALMAFEKGDLDEVTLSADDLVNYKMSEYLLKTDETYTGRYIFATDLEKLTALEEEANDGKNKKVLFYDDFRKAISLSIDRNQFCTDCTSGFKPAYFLLNNLYYYDIEHNTESQYRNTDAGREAVLRLYGVQYGDGTPFATAEEAYNSINGYDVEAAKALFQAVYEKAIADGNYKEGQEVHIRCEASAAALAAEDTRQQEYLNDYVAKATVGTGFEGKISFEFLGNIESRYEDVALGKIEMIRGAWGGAAFYPFSTIRVYCEPDYMGGLTKIHESCGWDPTTEKMTITIDGREVEKTLQDWAKSMNGAGEYADDKYVDIKLQILSNLESAILGSYQCIPYGTYTDCSLFSKKIKYATTTYNIMYGYGGIRLMTFNYNDEDWAKFVQEQGGTINYK